MRSLVRGSSWLGFLSLATGAAILVAISLISLRNYQSSSDATLDAAEVIVQEAVLFIRLLEAETAERGYLATGNASFRTEFDEAKAATEATLEPLLARDNWTPEQKAALDRLATAAREHLSRLQVSVDLVSAGNITEAVANADLETDQRLMTEVQANLQTIASVEASQRDAAESSADRRALASAIGIMSLSVITASLAAWVFISIRRQGTADSLRRANQAKDEVLAMLAHELRSPITIISGHARLLRMRFDSLDGEERSASLSDVERESERIDRMVSQMLALSGDDTVAAPELEPVRVRDLIDRSVERHSKLHGGSDVVVHGGPGLPLALADPDYTEQVIENLLSNATKYGPAGESIEVEARAVGQWIEVSVRDGGAGIPLEARERIFEPFVRIPGTSRREGMGLGLAVCRRLMRAQGGDVWVDGASQPGTTFTLRLGKEPSPDRRT